MSNIPHTRKSSMNLVKKTMKTSFDALPRCQCQKSRPTLARVASPNAANTTPKPTMLRMSVRVMVSSLGAKVSHCTYYRREQNQQKQQRQPVHSEIGHVPSISRIGVAQ